MSLRKKGGRGFVIPITVPCLLRRFLTKRLEQYFVSRVCIIIDYFSLMEFFVFIDVNQTVTLNLISYLIYSENQGKAKNFYDMNKT